jgi:hypothetical protein
MRAARGRTLLGVPASDGLDRKHSVSQAALAKRERASKSTAVAAGTPLAVGRQLGARRRANQSIDEIFDQELDANPIAADNLDRPLRSLRWLSGGC